jgi:ATP-binding cassette subfamily C protein LapB
MDRTTEHNLLTSIRNYMIRSDRTLVISTHKLALLELVDRIIVIDQGRIIADGPRDIILNKLSAATTGN